MRFFHHLNSITIPHAAGRACPARYFMYTVLAGGTATAYRWPVAHVPADLDDKDPI